MENNPTLEPIPWHSKITHFLERMPVVYQFLRFACIGFLNTGLSFLVVNTISKFFGISQGWKLGVIVGIGFVCAVIQSYPWNRTWTFGGEQGVTLWNNLVRLCMVGALGVIALAFVLVASRLSAPAVSYLIFLVIYLIAENVLWQHFGFAGSRRGKGNGKTHLDRAACGGCFEGGTSWQRKQH